MENREAARENALAGTARVAAPMASTRQTRRLHPITFCAKEVIL